MQNHDQLLIAVHKEWWVPYTLSKCDLSFSFRRAFVNKKLLCNPCLFVLYLALALTLNSILSLAIYSGDDIFNYPMSNRERASIVIASLPNVR